MTFEKSIEKYITNRSSRLAPQSLRTYRYNLEKFSRWLGEIDLKDVTDDHVDGFLAYLVGKLTEKTRENYAITLRAFFKHWNIKHQSKVAWELILSPRVPEKFPDFISREQFELIDDCFDEDEYYQLTKKVIVHMLWNTGMRISELLNLNLNDIHVQKNYAYVTTLKSGKLRMVMWNDECHRLLIKYLGIRISLNKREELFQTPENPKHRRRRARLTPRTVQRWCQELQEFLGFRIHPHAFRHGKLHEILNSGGTRHHVQTVAGHSSITSSEIYTRLNLTEQSKLLTRFLPKDKKPRHKLPMVDNSMRFAA